MYKVYFKSTGDTAKDRAHFIGVSDKNIPNVRTVKEFKTMLEALEYKDVLCVSYGVNSNRRFPNNVEPEPKPIVSYKELNYKDPNMKVKDKRRLSSITKARMSKAKLREDNPLRGKKRPRFKCKYCNVKMDIGNLTKHIKDNHEKETT